MMDYDEGLEKEEKLRLIIGKTAIITILLCASISMFISTIKFGFENVEGVVIEDIHHGQVYQLKGGGYIVEQEGMDHSEYAVIKNNSSKKVNLKDWHLYADDPGEDFYFPSIIIRPGQSCRVYTNEIHPVYYGLSFGIERAIWSFSDCGYLYDNNGVLVDEYCE